MSGMPSKGCLFLGTTEKLHIFILLLFSVFTVHLPNCVIIVLLYILNLMSFFIATSFSLVDLGYYLLKMWKGIMLPSLPESVLYDNNNLAWLDDVFKFAVMTEHLLFKLVESI